jgi:16S rRNA (guanine966-N2)-methyltransferase
MSEKMRGAIFGILGDIDGLRVLDAFSGSGALAFESISRGADSAVAIEVDKRAYEVIRKNIDKLDLAHKVKVVRAYANAWSTRHQVEKFDIIMLDPPYDNLPFRDLNAMPKHLKEDGLLVLSWPGQADWYPFEGLELVQSRNYGDSSLHIYKNKQ